MDRYLLEAEVILPVLGFHVLRPVEQADAPDEERRENRASYSASTDANPVFVFTDSMRTRAFARMISGEFVLLANSLMRADSVETLPAGTVAQREELIKDEDAIPIPGGKHYELKRNVPCSSPLRAVGIVSGTTANAQTAWKIKGEEDVTYGDWLAKQFE